MDGGGFEGEEKANGKKRTGGGWGRFGGWRVRRPRGNSLGGGRVCPGKKPGPTARWSGGEEARGRREEEARQSEAAGGSAERQVGGNRRRDLCRGAEPGPSLAGLKGGAFPE